MSEFDIDDEVVEDDYAFIDDPYDENELGEADYDDYDDYEG